MTDRKRMTNTQVQHWQHATDARRMIEYDLHSVAMKERCLSKELDKIWEDWDRRDAREVPVTIRQDTDVVKFFKTMGTGYQPRINRVLRCFMHDRLAGILEGPDTTDYVLHPERLKPTWERPARRNQQVEDAEIKEQMQALGIEGAEYLAVKSRPACRAAPGPPHRGGRSCGGRD